MSPDTKALSCGLSQDTLQKIRSVLAAHPEVESAILYGSRAIGNFRPSSDIDLTLTGEQLTLSILLRIDTEIDDLLLPYLFDLSILSHIHSPTLLDHIYRVGIPLYERVAQNEVL
ncbi:MAG: nucleotidyltransferase domain-containing protein [Cyanobacteria bacterium J06606_4]